MAISSSMAKKIARRIEMLSSPTYRLRRLVIKRREYASLLKETHAAYHKQYGGYLCDSDAVAEGYDNIVFHGVTVCCEPSASEIN